MEMAELQSVFDLTFNTAVQQVLTYYNITYSLKQQQLSAIKLVCQRKHTFAVLPTGFGKSDIFGLLPLIMDNVRCIIL